jgi:zinc and cadmium transporter
MSVLAWIVIGGIAMTAIALIGSVTLLVDADRLQRLLLPLVALAAGSLLGGAFFHMLPAVLEAGAEPLHVFIWTAGGFLLFLILEQVLHWHHCRNASASCREPLTYLVLIGDGLHNLLGGAAVAGAFLIDVRVGLMAWLAAAAHEVPQELGDFAVLVHGGWTKSKALLLNALSGATFLVGGLVAYGISFEFDVAPLVAFAAGNFIYIAASDLIPEVNRENHAKRSAVLLLFVIVGVCVLLALRIALPAS